MYCASCGTEIPEYAAYCPLCGHRIASRSQFGGEQGTPSPQPRPHAVKVKQISVTTAVLLSIIPGLGEIYLGNVWKGIGFFVFAVALLGIGLEFSAIVWAIDLYVAYSDAKSMEHRP